MRFGPKFPVILVEWIAPYIYQCVSNNNELYLHDNTNTYNIAKTMSGLGIKITTQGNYVTLIIICHEHQNKLKYML